MSGLSMRTQNFGWEKGATGDQPHVGKREVVESHGAAEGGADFVAAGAGVVFVRVIGEVIIVRDHAACEMGV